MPFDWWAVPKIFSVVRGATGGALSLVHAVRGKNPTLRFEVRDAAVCLVVDNPRSETIVVEWVECDPPMIGVMNGSSVEAAATALLAHQGHRPDEALLFIDAGAQTAVHVITFYPFDTASADTLVRVRAHWRSTHHGLFSRGRVGIKISVRDVRGLRAEAEKRGPRIFGI